MTDGLISFIANMNYMQWAIIGIFIGGSVWAVTVYNRYQELKDSRS